MVVESAKYMLVLKKAQSKQYMDKVRRCHAAAKLYGACQVYPCMLRAA